MYNSKAVVGAFKSQTLDEVFEHALQIECAIYSQFKKLKSVAKSLTLSPTTKPHIHTRNTLVEQRRALRLYLDVVKDITWIVIKIKVQMLIRQNTKEKKRKEKEALEAPTPLPEELEFTNEEAIIFMHLTTITHIYTV
jgi:hypothetical protein